LVLYVQACVIIVTTPYYGYSPLNCNQQLVMLTKPRLIRSCGSSLPKNIFGT